MRSRVLVAVALALALCTAGCDWPMFGYAPDHTRANGDLAISSALAGGLVPAWTASTAAAVTSSPSVFGGRVYVVSDKLYAFDATGGAGGCSGTPKTCTPLWTAAVSGSGLSSPAVDSNVVYAGSSDGHLYAFDAMGNTNCSGGTPKTCTPLWSASVGQPVTDSSPTVAGGVVYIGSNDGKLYAFDAAGKSGCTSAAPVTCSPLWTGATGGPVASSPAVANSTVYVGSNDGKLYAFDAAGKSGCTTAPVSCSPLFTAATGGPVASSPGVSNGTVYVGSDDSKLYAFDAGGKTGCATGPPVTCTALWTANTGAPLRASPAIINGIAYTASDRMYSFDAAGTTNCSGSPRSCTPLWTAPLPSPVVSSPALSNGSAFVGSLDGALRVYTLFSGSGLNEINGGGSEPPDETSAIGPTRFIELVNDAYSISDRSGTVISAGPSPNLYGSGGNFISDPQILWDPASSRFFFAEITDTGAPGTPNWGIILGFSKTDSPSTTADWCRYTFTDNYGSTLPDFPKLGLTADFALVGINRFPGSTAGSVAQASISAPLGSDLNWFAKPANGTINVCPTQSTLTHGVFRQLKTQAGNAAFTPIPSREVDTSSTGYVVATGDPVPATTLALYTVGNNNGAATLSSAATVTVPSYSDPLEQIPQKGGNAIDASDSRLTQAYLAIDPRLGHTALWTAHSVHGGAGSQVRWYEINAASHTVDQTGTVSDPNLDVFYAALAPDRAVFGGSATFGSNMVLTVNTSSSNTNSAVGMVSKAGAQAQSPLTIIQASTTAWSCTKDGPPRSACRWGDYSGASPDPLPPAGTGVGRVWLTNQWNDANNWQTWSWAASAYP